MGRIRWLFPVPLWRLTPLYTRMCCIPDFHPRFHEAIDSMTQRPGCQCPPNPPQVRIHQLRCLRFPPPVILVIQNHKSPIGGIIGGVLGGLVLLTVLALIAILKRRSRRRLGRTTPGPIILGDKGDVDPRPYVQPSTARPPDNIALAEQIRVLQAQTAELQLALRAHQAPSADTRLTSMKRGA
jgi:hypothetical protein